ncbi:MAG: helix-turn-helix transcriptional regulator [Caulobacteraceae bacterium]
MPIRVHLDRILLERRMSLTELADRVGVTIANLSILKTGKARAIRFSTLDALCRELNCQPGDLVVFEPGPPDDDGRMSARRNGAMLP